MSKETIMLAKNLDPKKLEFPCVAVEKLDGVPAVFSTVSTSGAVNAFTRQGELLASVDHINQALFGMLPEGHELIGELYIRGMSFKDIGGLVRRQFASPELILYIWDYVVTQRPEFTYQERMAVMARSQVGLLAADSTYYQETRFRASVVPNKAKVAKEYPIKLLPGEYIADEKRLDEYIEEFAEHNQDAEGLIFRPLNGKYQAAKRSWDLQRWKGEETVDLKLVGIEEAISEAGYPKGMAGRLVCEYKGKQIGVGPGKLDHNQRKWLWAEPDRFIGKIIEVAYKPDDTYEALREARFKRFRDDKFVPNIE